MEQGYIITAGVAIERPVRGGKVHIAHLGGRHVGSVDDPGINRGSHGISIEFD